MTKTQKIKFAVIGCEHIGKRHTSMIQENSACALVALCDICPSSLPNIDLYSEATFFLSIDALLALNIAID